jgi:hypothetical protein
LEAFPTNSATELGALMGRILAILAEMYVSDGDLKSRRIAVGLGAFVIAILAIDLLLLFIMN